MKQCCFLFVETYDRSGYSIIQYNTDACRVVYRRKPTHTFAPINPSILNQIDNIDRTRALKDITANALQYLLINLLSVQTLIVEKQMILMSEDCGFTADSLSHVAGSRIARSQAAI